MPIKPHTCVSVQCDTCHEVYDRDEGGEQHFTDETEARTEVARAQWLITADGRVICEGCGTDDPAHQAYFAKRAPA